MARPGSRLTALAAVHLTAAAAVAIAALSPANAQSSLSLDVTATVGNACSVEIKSGGNTLDFGTLTGSQQDSSATELTVSCDIAETQATLQINDGLYFGEGQGSGPKLKSNTGPSPAYIPYNLCQGEPGPDCFPLDDTPIVTGPGGTDRKIRARIDEGQTFTQAGAYHDQLSVTVTLND